MASSHQEFNHQQNKILTIQPNGNYWGFLNRVVTRQRQIHDQHDRFTYYRNCLIGGVLSSSVRWVLTPFDSVKCNMQVHPQQFPTFTKGLQTLFYEGRLFRGLVPTALSYSHQTGIKYAMYEWNKDTIIEWLRRNSNDPENDIQKYKSIIFLLSSGCAEAVADVFMCPWEIIKVQMQTSQTNVRLGSAIGSLVQRSDLVWTSLGPLWGRQIIGTMANFFTFEHSAKFIYRNVVGVQSKKDCSASTQLFVTFGAGYVSGIVASVVSHPADSIISLRTRHPNLPLQILVHQAGGWKVLATKGLIPRIAMTGSILSFQWLVYDAFKTAMGMGTTGGD